MILDCVIANFELDVLEVRLRELAPVVDRFVVVEAARTHSGKPKPLAVSAARERFAEFGEQLAVVALDDLHAPTPQGRNNEQMTAFARAFPERLTADDLVLVSDLDEIPSAETVRRLAASPPADPLAVRQAHHYFALDWRSRQPWGGTVAVRGDRYPGGWQLREHRWGPSVDGGWHLAYLGGAAAVRRKYQSNWHVEFDQPHLLGDEHVRACIRDGHDVMGRVDFELERVDPRACGLPAWLVDHLDRFPAFTFPGVLEA